MSNQLRITLRSGNEVKLTISDNLPITNALRNVGIPFSDINIRKTIDNWNSDNKLNCKICVVIDDDIDVLYTQQELLCTEVHFVLTYRYADTAMKHLANWLCADVAIVDYNMPRVKGDEILSYMKVNTDIPRLILRTASYNVVASPDIEVSYKPERLKI